MDVGENKSDHCQKATYFQKEGRSEVWRAIEKRTRQLIGERKKKYNETTRDKFINKTDSKSFHKGVKAFLSAKETEKWDARSLYPGKTDREIAELLADYFNGISQEYDPLDITKIPTTYERRIPPLTAPDIATRLRKTRKTTSRVQGDIFASLYGLYSSELAEPVTEVFNQIITERNWAALWRTEYITVIPKVPSPLDPGDCRNIACTNFLSKVLEGIVLGWAREEVVPKENQFGGERGCSTSHMLVHAWDQIATGLEDNRLSLIHI